MSDTYDAIYHAFTVTFDGAKWSIDEKLTHITNELTRPSVMFKPTITQDGNAWIALLGDDLAVGVVGSGDSPEAAMRDFDRSWYASTEYRGESK